MYNNNDDGGIKTGLLLILLFGFVLLAIGTLAVNTDNGIYVFSNVIGDVGDGSVAVAGDNNHVNNQPVIEKTLSPSDLAAYGGLGICIFGSMGLLGAIALISIVFKRN